MQGMGTGELNNTRYTKRRVSDARHCEERSDEAIHQAGVKQVDCFASLAMTGLSGVFVCLLTIISYYGKLIETFVLFYRNKEILND